MCRGNKRLSDPTPSTQLQEGDIIVLYGTLSHIEHAEKIFTTWR